VEGSRINFFIAPPKSFLAKLSELGSSLIRSRRMFVMG